MAGLYILDGNKIPHKLLDATMNPSELGWRCVRETQNPNVKRLAEEYDALADTVAWQAKEISDLEQKLSTKKAATSRKQN